jgi:2-phosphosulfolactate phosphatase
LVALDAVIEALRLARVDGSGDVQIVCSGTDGRAALEDVYVSGRVSAALTGQRSDGAVVAESVARGYRTAFDALAASAHARVLIAAGLEQDIAYCAQESVLDIVPRVLVAADGTSVVSDSAHPQAADDRDLRVAIPST